MRKIAHIINPFKARETSDLYKAQPITFASMLKAVENAKRVVDVELLSAQFEEDRDVVPVEFSLTKHLTHSVLNESKFKQPVKLPLLKDILERLYQASDADYLIYSNVDIGLYPDFYLKVNAFIEEGHDAFIINRRRLSSEYLNHPNLEQIYLDKGKKHPGFDCFIFHRSLYPAMKLENVCIGVPFIEITLSQNLFALAKNFKLVEDEILTFHIGMEIYKKRMPREYFWYNRRQFHNAENQLFCLMRLNKFPYAENPWPVKLIKWLLHPCIPTRLVLKLMLRRQFN